MIPSFLLIAAACGGDAESDATGEPAATNPPAASPSATAPPAATATVAATEPPEEDSGLLDELIELASGFEEVAVWGDRGGVSFEGPNGLTVDGDGAVYVTEFRGGHLRKFTPDGELLFEVGGTGNADGRLGNPIGVAVDRDGVIYVSESGTSRVSIFSADGGFRSSFGEFGGEPGQFRSAMGIAVSEAFEIFVADFGNHRVQVFDRDGTLLRSWGERGTEPGQLENPIGLQIGPGGNVWVVDSANERVQVFGQDGELVRVFDDVGAGPQVLSVNAAGEFYVASPWADTRVRRFDAEGRLLGTVGMGVTGAELDEMSSAERQRAGKLTRLNGPHGTATDASGAVYVADTANGVVRKFAPTEG